MKVYSQGKIPVKCWAKNIDANALEQAVAFSNHPRAFKHVAIMPDGHLGYGIPVGGVVALKDAIIPYGVGSDIGCGMMAVKTNLTKITEDQTKEIMGIIREKVPVGKNWRNTPAVGMDEFHAKVGFMPSEEIVSKQSGKALLQLGTLGGGNHFIEIQKGDDGHIWFMIHSGSRNLGKQVCDYYHQVAVELCEEFASVVPKELSFLPFSFPISFRYLNEMNCCLKFAYFNRAQMSVDIEKAFKTVIGHTFAQQVVNIHHNYAAEEEHFGQKVWIHRKGATSAREGEWGIIPGSQGSHSYIVQGKGNPESFMSCSHGAGRKMGRQEAIRTLNFDVEIKKLNEAGVIHSVRNKKDLDEAPGAYKSIGEVMRNQKDLVDIKVKLTPLGVVKG